jgi:hypothetical protein
LSVLRQTPDPQITLITCTPPGTSWKRLVVVAKQISPAPATAQPSKTGTQDGSASETLPGNSPGFTNTLNSLWDKATSIFKGGQNPSALPGDK